MSLTYLHISMQNLAIVELFEATNDLDEYVPYLLFFDVGLPLLVATYFLEYIPIVSIFHYEAKSRDYEIP